jgi:1A family penicillin-binding protein
VTNRFVALLRRAGEYCRCMPAWARYGPVAAVLILSSMAAAWERCLLQTCPDISRLSSYQPGAGLVLLDRNGRTLEELLPVEGQVVRLASLPRHVPEAFVAVEDHRFREHDGVDWIRVLGALWADVRAGEVVEGSSTITMQLARNVFADQIRASDRTLSRKLLEVRAALHIEEQFGKDEILELYLNHIYFGRGAHGVEAAARQYFGVEAAKLSLPQAALLAAMVKAPARYDPRRNPELARERRDLVLGRMEQQRRISPAQAREARAADLGVTLQPPAAAVAPYFVEEVRRTLEEQFGTSLYDEPLRVTTTLDSTAQAAAEQELERQLELVEKGVFGRSQAPRYSPSDQPPIDTTAYLQGAVMAVEVGSGDVLAWVGGRDFRQSRFDRVTGSRRQAGSAFKPFVYAAALEAGRSLNERLLDEPLEVRLSRKDVWIPKNYDGAFEGLISMRDALVRSKNIPTIRLAHEVGIGAVAAFAERVGIEPPIPDEPSMPLGTVEVSLAELTQAYGGFASLGQRVAARLILRVDRPNGELVWSAPVPQPRRVMQPGIAYLITDALRDALARGTGTAVRQAGFKAPAAGKTGTTNDGADAWFIGYTPDVVMGVWIGFDERQPIVTKATGARIAAPVWARVMQRYSDGRRSAASPWSRTPDVVDAMVDARTGFVLLAGCAASDGRSQRELFLRGHEPVAVCPNPEDRARLEYAVLGDPAPVVEPSPQDIGVRSYTPSRPPQPTPSPDPTNR